MEKVHILGWNDQQFPLLGTQLEKRALQKQRIGTMQVLGLQRGGLLPLSTRNFREMALSHQPMTFDVFNSGYPGVVYQNSAGVNTIQGHGTGGWIHHIDTTPDRKFIFTSDNLGVLKQWNQQMVLIHSYGKTLDNGIVGITFSTDSARVYIINRDNELKIFCTKTFQLTGETAQRLRNRENPGMAPVTGKCYCIKIISSQGRDQQWKTDDRGLLTCWSTCGQGSYIGSYKLSDGIQKKIITNGIAGNKLYLGDNKGDLKVFDVDLGEVTKERLKIQDGGIHAIDVTADGKKIYTTGFGNFLKEQDAGRMRLRRDFGKIHTDGLIKDIKISGDGRMLTTSDSNGTVKVWSLKRALLLKIVRVRPGVLSIGAI